MQRVVAAAVAALALTVTAPATSRAAVTNITTPLDAVAFVPCANGGTGESVHVTGTLHFRISSFTDGNGGMHSTTLVRPQGVSAVGLTTGATYQFRSVSKDVFNQGDVGSVLISVNNIRLIGPGPSNNAWEHNLVHVTVNANGTVTAISSRPTSSASSRLTVATLGVPHADTPRRRLLARPARRRHAVARYAFDLRRAGERIDEDAFANGRWRL